MVSKRNIALIVGALVVLSFQNCSKKVDFASIDETSLGLKVNEAGVPEVVPTECADGCVADVEDNSPDDNPTGNTTIDDVEDNSKNDDHKR